MTLSEAYPLTGTSTQTIQSELAAGVIVAFVSLGVDAFVTDQAFDWDNEKAAERVRWSYRVLTTLVVVVTMTGSGLGLSAVDYHVTARVVLYLPAIAVLGAFLGFMAGLLLGNSMVIAFVPRSISFRDGAILGDFRRTKWTGPTVREIRLEDVRFVGLSTLSRLPQVDARRRTDPQSPLKYSQIFYLTESNMKRLQDIFRNAGHIARA